MAISSFEILEGSLNAGDGDRDGLATSERERFREGDLMVAPAACMRKDVVEVWSPLLCRICSVKDELSEAGGVACRAAIAASKDIRSNCAAGGQLDNERKNANFVLQMHFVQLDEHLAG